MPKNKTIGTKVSEAQFAEVEAAAKQAGRTPSQWLREAIEAKLRNEKHASETLEMLATEIALLRSEVKATPEKLKLAAGTAIHIAFQKGQEIGGK